MFGIFAICLSSLSALLFPMAQAQTGSPSRMEIQLEKRDGRRVLSVDPGFVFARHDQLRFRFKSNFDGYLYVMNRGTAGAFSLLFPKDESGTDNRIESGKSYLLPATTGGWYGVEGPPGHDIVYFLISPAPFTSGETGGGAPFPIPPLPQAAAPPEGMMPRCNDAIFKARGDCVDTTAGPKPVLDREAVPGNLPGVPVTPRDLYFMKKEKSTVIGSPVPLTGPVLYEFRVAHK